MRWVGSASSVQAVAQTIVKHRRDADGRRIAIGIPDHLEIICGMVAGGTANLTVSSVSGLVPEIDIWLVGSEGTLHLESIKESKSMDRGIRILGGRRGDETLTEIAVPEDKRGGWRVEEEFINAIRGTEIVTHTGFVDGVKYMEFTDAVTRAWQSGEKVNLPL